ncbi:mitochondrial zinc maintenance protein 1, mitochondrial [Calycina marina]|uniref:Mitochondrial zinc maintenance protein 1, mitochondrial n=1 Tax=Calycina marina TaxID=1763456 RepID=A0A9P7Z619_9HELO|nr:mitochondrial zinc maintenance protein 1, mitochondrial [Calycina marina]
MASSPALTAYRMLLRSTRLAFAGDAPMLLAARAEAGNMFRQNSSLPSQSPETIKAIKHAEEVAAILKANVVQGKQIRGDEERYKLRIHEHTERGDNDTIKMPDGQKVTIDGKTCSS